MTGVVAWWVDLAKTDIEAIAPKSLAYGSNSLEQLGHKLAQLSGRTIDSEEAQELGCWINAVQKIERWTDAVMRGERPADDTLMDLMIYTGMARRIRENGSWP